MLLKKKKKQGEKNIEMERESALQLLSPES